MDGLQHEPESWTNVILGLYAGAIALLTSIVGFFLKNLHADLKETKNKQGEDSERIAVLETMAVSTKESQDRMHEKLDRLLDK